jgi:hypothetical protein
MRTLAWRRRRKRKERLSSTAAMVRPVVFCDCYVCDVAADEDKDEAMAARRENVGDESDGGSRSRQADQEEDGAAGATGSGEEIGDSEAAAQDLEAPRKKTRIVDDDE